MQPALIPSGNLLAHVEGSMNAVMVHSDAAGLTMYYGAGAGAEQTASAVIADLVDVSRFMGIAHQHRVPYLAYQESAMARQAMVAFADVCSSYYLRIDLRNGAQGLPELDQLLCNAGCAIGPKGNAGTPGYARCSVCATFDCSRLTFPNRRADYCN